MQDFNGWAAPVAGRELRAAVAVPGSKSLMARELVLSALADGTDTIRNALVSRDSALMADGLRALGTEITECDTANGRELTVTPLKLPGAAGEASIDCGLAGTVMRFLPPVAALTGKTVHFDGDPHARKRPMQELLGALRDLGVCIDTENDALPFTLSAGEITGGEVRMDAAKSSQFVSALLLAAPRFQNGITIIHTGDTLPSIPHIEMTLQSLRERGVDAESLSETSWRVQPGKIQAKNTVIEPDLSNAAPFLAAALVAGGEVSIPHWPSNTTQVGDKLREYLPLFGATVSLNNGVLTVSGKGKHAVTGVDLNLAEAGELAPTLAGLAALANSPSRISGIAHLRGHETDRLAALVAEINRLGGDATELPDGIAINPKPLTGGLWRCYADHRMATTGALIGLAAPGVILDDIACTSKTMPDFPELWQGMLAHTD